VTDGLETLIAIDTSTSLGSVGLIRGGRVLAYRLPLTGREQASGIVPSISAVLEEAEVDRTEIGGVLVGRGPGSFTGVRVAVATARGLAKGLAVPVWPYSSLAAAAASRGMHLRVAREGAGPAAAETVDEDGPQAPTGEGAASPPAIWVLFDARGDRVYAACYVVSADGIETLVPPTPSTVGEILALDLPVEAAFSGDGALRHADAIVAAGRTVLSFPAGLPTPHGLLRLHELRPRDGSDAAPARWEPEYLRGEWGVRPQQSTEPRT
jgi:tRNA threonylcarbamoyl adenosine modification protein YeaZ